MDEKRRPLYIPVKTLDSEDYIEGIGKLEVALIGAGVMVGITVGMIIQGITGNFLIAFAVGLVIVILSIGVFKRDNTNENLIRKLMIIYRFIHAQKKYMYYFFDSLNAMDIDEDKTTEVGYE